MILTHHGINSLGRGEEYPDEAYDFDMADIKRIFPAADENSGITLGAVITPTRNIVVDSYAWFAYQQERNNWNPAVGIYETDMSITEHYAQNLTKLWGSTSNDRISVTNNVFELNGKQWDKILVTLPQAVTLEAGKTYTIFTRKKPLCTGRRGSRRCLRGPGQDPVGLHLLRLEYPGPELHHGWARYNACRVSRN